MRNRIFITGLLALLAALFVSPAQAMTADEYYADGNRLARDDLYWAALLRYSQAAEQGLDTPILHYNTGVTHYKAGQHIRARESLLKALDDPSLRVVTHYNLGLNAWALGDTDEALRWFRLARDQETDPKLRKYAVVAIARIRVQQEEPTEYEVIVEEREEKRAFTNLNLRARLGYGHDSNIFRSPDQPYIDLADPDQPLVTPVVQSGAFIPLNLSAQYMVNSLPYEGFYGAYRMFGRYYVDELYENGNEYLHELSFGSEYEFFNEEKSRKRYIHSAFAIAQNDKVYYDPDDGLGRIVDGEEVVDRMNYVRFGPTLTARQTGEALSFGINLKGEIWDYEDTEVLPEYDHEYFAGELFTQFSFASTSLLRITASYYSRRYGDRLSFDLDGVQRPGNPTMRYDHVALGVRARQRITRSMWFGFDVERQERTDQYVGYNDYTRDSFSAEFHWSPGYRFDLDLDVTYRLYDYPNAFAFHEPAAGRKTHESLDARFDASYRVTRNLSIVAEATLREVVSNDIRIQYDRTQYLIGVRWEQ